MSSVEHAAPPARFEVVPVTTQTDTDTFESGDADLDDFLKRQAVPYSEKDIAKTYAYVRDGEILGYFSVCADALRLSPEERSFVFQTTKTHVEYPAVKIARLAVSKRAQRQGIGARLVETALGKILLVSQVIGCRFITVDAYIAALPFYQKLGFAVNQADKSGRNFTSLRLDLHETSSKAATLSP